MHIFFLLLIFITELFSSPCVVSTSDIFINEGFIFGTNIKETQSQACPLFENNHKANRFIKKGTIIKKSDYLLEEQKVMIQYGEFITFEFDGKLVSYEPSAIKIQEPDFKIKKITTEGVFRHAND